MGDGAAVPGCGLDHAVAIAQCFGSARDAGSHGFSTVVGPETGDVVQISLVSRNQVIPIQAVFNQEFPIGFHGVLVGSGDYPHPLVGLVYDQVQVVPCRPPSK